MSYYAIDRSNELSHHGILGMKWGIRRYQNDDGSLTSAGRIRYYGAGGDRKGYYKQKGQGKRYHDVLKYATNVSYGIAAHPGVMLSKGYRTWRKSDPNNRGIANYANYYRQNTIASEFGNNKRALADAKYAYEHKKLAKYVNRDGSLTTAGKLKYWDTNANRGKARMERDIARDKERGTTTERNQARFNKKSLSAYKRKRAEGYITLGESALTGLESVGKMATLRPISATRSAVKSAKQGIRGLRQLGKANKWYTRQNSRTEYGQNRGINSQAAIETKVVNRTRQTANNIANKAKQASAINKEYWNNAKGTGIKKYGNYVIDTNKQTMVNIKNAMKKRKRN